MVFILDRYPIRVLLSDTVIVRFRLHADRVKIDLYSRDELWDNFAAKLTQLFETSGVVVGQFVVVESQ